MFISVAYNKKIRYQWFKLARQDPKAYDFLFFNSPIYFIKLTNKLTCTF